jgi:hypothetical protein
LSDFWITLHLTHTVLYSFTHYNAVGFTLGVKPRGSRLEPPVHSEAAGAARTAAGSRAFGLWRTEGEPWVRSGGS